MIKYSCSKPNQKSLSSSSIVALPFEGCGVPSAFSTSVITKKPSFLTGSGKIATGFNRQSLKKHVVILADVNNDPMVKYIHGNVGKGTFTFLGGHDPEDYKHYVGDPATDLLLHRNSPGYRLILNNVLFPAAKKKKRKT